MARIRGCGSIQKAQGLPSALGFRVLIEGHHLIAIFGRTEDVNGDNSCEYLEFTAACLLSMEEEFDELLRQEFRILDTKRAGADLSSPKP